MRPGGFLRVHTVCLRRGGTTFIGWPLMHDGGGRVSFTVDPVMYFVSSLGPDSLLSRFPIAHPGAEQHLAFAYRHLGELGGRRIFASARFHDWVYPKR